MATFHNEAGSNLTAPSTDNTATPSSHQFLQHWSYSSFDQQQFPLIPLTHQVGGHGLFYKLAIPLFGQNDDPRKKKKKKENDPFSLDNIDDREDFFFGSTDPSHTSSHPSYFFHIYPHLNLDNLDAYQKKGIVCKPYQSQEVHFYEIVLDEYPFLVPFLPCYYGILQIDVHLPDPSPSMKLSMSFNNFKSSHIIPSKHSRSDSSINVGYEEGCDCINSNMSTTKNKSQDFSNEKEKLEKKFPYDDLLLSSSRAPFQMHHATETVIPEKRVSVVNLSENESSPSSIALADHIHLRDKNSGINYTTFSIPFSSDSLAYNDKKSGNAISSSSISSSSSNFASEYCPYSSSSSLNFAVFNNLQKDSLVDENQTECERIIDSFNPSFKKIESSVDPDISRASMSHESSRKPLASMTFPLSLRYPWCSIDSSKIPQSEEDDVSTDDDDDVVDIRYPIVRSESSRSYSVSHSYDPSNCIMHQKSLEAPLPTMEPNPMAPAAASISKSSPSYLYHPWAWQLYQRSMRKNKNPLGQNTTKFNGSASPSFYPEGFSIIRNQPSNIRPPHSHLSSLISTSPGKSPLSVEFRRAPLYDGSAIAPPSPTSFILLEDLTGNLKFPCILDLKMGRRHYGIFSSATKRSLQKAKTIQSTSHLLAIRLCGMQVYKRSLKKYVFISKYEGRKLSEKQLYNALSLFFDADSFLEDLNGNTRNRKRHILIPTLLTKLKELREIIKAKIPHFRFYASSLLILYDAANFQQSNISMENLVDVRIIDFAHCYPEKDYSYLSKYDDEFEEGPDKDYIDGLDHLIDMLDQVSLNPSASFVSPRK